MKILLFTFTILASLSAIAQDYVILAKGDSLTGELKLLYFDERLDKVQVNADNKKTVYTALQVKNIMLDGVEYQPMKFENAFRFMKILKRGYLGLYTFRPAGMQSFDRLYLYRKDGSGIEVPNLGFKKMMIKFLEDCPEVRKRVDQGELGKRDLNAIVDLYNGCIDRKSGSQPKQVVQEKPKDSAEKSIALKNLIAKIDAENFATKKDVLDILNDIHEKISKNTTIPNYLTEALKTYLGPVTDHAKDLEEILSALKK